MESALPILPDAVLLLAVNGTIPDDFKVHIKSSGQDFDVGTPATSNKYQDGNVPYPVNFLDGAVDETFDKNDFIYGTQSWKPNSVADSPIFYGEDQSNSLNQFHLMFVDLKVGAVQNTSLTNNGMIKVEYEFTNLTGKAVFHSYGWYMQSNHGTGIIMTNANGGSEYSVTPPVTVIAPVATFTTNTTSGTAPLAVQFIDASTNTPTSWAWDFDNDGVIDSTEQSPAYTYTTAGTYTVNLTATNSAGSSSEVKTDLITVTTGVVTLPGQTAAPTDSDGDGKYDDLNANGEIDFNDVIVYFNQMEWIEANEPVSSFDYNGNNEIDFNDVIVLFHKA